MTTFYDQQPTFYDLHSQERSSGRGGRGGGRQQSHGGYRHPSRHYPMQGLDSTASADNQSWLGRSVTIAAAVAAVAAGAAIGTAVFGDGSDPARASQPVVLMPTAPGASAPTLSNAPTATQQNVPPTIYVPKAGSTTTMVLPPPRVSSAPRPPVVAPPAPAQAAPVGGPASVPAAPGPKVDVIVGLPNLVPQIGSSESNQPANQDNSGQGTSGNDPGQGTKDPGENGKGDTGKGDKGDGNTGGAGGSADKKGSNTVDYGASAGDPPNPETGTVDYGASAADGGSASSPISTQNPMGCSFAGQRVC